MVLKCTRNTEENVNEAIVLFNIFFKVKGEFYIESNSSACKTCTINFHFLKHVVEIYK